MNTPRPFRLVQSLYFEIIVGTAGSTFEVALDRKGNSTTSRGDGHGDPRPPKLRTIDLRPGDEIK